jgi:hypothetical protein
LKVRNWLILLIKILPNSNKNTSWDSLAIIIFFASSATWRTRHAQLMLDDISTTAWLPDIAMRDMEPAALTAIVQQIGYR